MSVVRTSNDSLSRLISEAFEKIADQVSSLVNQRNITERQLTDPDYFRQNHDYIKDVVAESIKANAEHLSRRADTPGLSSGQKYDNAVKILTDVADKLGVNADGIIAKIRETHATEKKASGAGGQTPFSWDKFNILNKELTKNIPPPNLKEAFQTLLVSKAQEVLKSYEEGSLDTSRLPEYWRGDIFQLEQEKRAGLRLYIYRDSSGSMGYALNNDNDSLRRADFTDEQAYEDARMREQIIAGETKSRIVDEIFVGLMETLFEAKDSGLDVKFYLGYWSRSLITVKDIDEDITLEELRERMRKRGDGGGTDILPVAKHYSQIPTSNTEKTVVMVLTDGELSDTYDFDPQTGEDDPGAIVSGIQLIKNHPTQHVHLWFPVGFKPSDEAKEIFGEFPTTTKMDVYQIIFSALERIIDQIYK